MPAFWQVVGRPPSLMVSLRLHLMGGSNFPTGNYGFVIRGEGKHAQWLKIKISIIIGTTVKTDDDTEDQSGEAVCERPPS